MPTRSAMREPRSPVRSVLIVLITIGMLVGCGYPLVPIFAVVWFGMLSLSVVWFPLSQSESLGLEEPAGLSKIGEWLRSIRPEMVPLLSNKAIWRFSSATEGDAVGGMSGLGMEGMGEERKRRIWNRPAPTHNAVTALLGGLVAVGIDLSISAMLSSDSFRQAGIGLLPRPVFISAASMIFGWMVMIGGLELRRPSDPDGGSAPDTSFVSGWKHVVPTILFPRKATDPDGGNAEIVDTAAHPGDVLEDGTADNEPKQKIGIRWRLIPKYSLVPLSALLVAADVAVFDYVHPITGVAGPALLLISLAAIKQWRTAVQDEIEELLNAWRERCAHIREWRDRWQAMPGAKPEKLPMFVQQVDYPEDNPVVRHCMFQLVEGRDWRDYVKFAPKLAPSLEAGKVLVEPAAIAGDEDEAHWNLISVWYELGHQLGSNPHLNPQTDGIAFSFAIRHAVVRAFLDMKLDVPILTGMSRLSAPGGDKLVWETQWALQGATTTEDVSLKANDLREHLGAPWLRVFTRPGQTRMSILHGYPPTEADIMSKNTRAFILEVEWEAAFRACKLVGDNGNPPRLLRTVENSMGLTELEFDLPPGLDPDRIRNKTAAIQTVSPWAYIEHRHLPDPSKHKMIVGETDPLAGMYRFEEYEELVLRDPVPGEPDISWAVGVGVDGKPIKYSWSGEEPHLLIAGSSGSGKSGVVNSMIVQIATNNTPEDVELWMAEPKVELQAYQHLAHVKRFIDPSSVTTSEYAACRWLLEEAYQEMMRRNELMSSHPSRPQKITEARYAASQDMDNWWHLMFPYIIIIIEECSSYFGKPTQKDDKEEYDRLMWLVSELARKSRSAGIHVVSATQYPTKQFIPQILKQNSRRIGLKTSDAMGSMVIIDTVGLEHIKEPGRGMVSGTTGYQSFRGFFFDAPAEGHTDKIDIRMDYVKQIPADKIWPKLSTGMTPNPLRVGQTVIWPDGSEHDPETPRWIADAVGAEALPQYLTDQVIEEAPAGQAPEPGKRSAPTSRRKRGNVGNRVRSKKNWLDAANIDKSSPGRFREPTHSSGESYLNDLEEFDDFVLPDEIDFEEISRVIAPDTETEDAEDNDTWAPPPPLSLTETAEEPDMVEEEYMFEDDIDLEKYGIMIRDTQD